MCCSGEFKNRKNIKNFYGIYVLAASLGQMYLIKKP